MRTMYSSSKFAFSGFAKALRSEVKPDNIHVLNVYPAYVQTNISKNAMIGNGETFGKTDDNIGKGMTCAAACDQIIKAMALKRTEFIVADKLFYHVIPFITMWSWLENFAADKKFKS